MTISIIAALDQNRGLGINGQIPWHIPADFKHFKQITMGHPVIMGRTTYESIGKPLPGRTNIIITTQPNYQAPPAKVVHSLNQALQLATNLDSTEVFICGGGQIYQQALPLTDKLYLTQVQGKFQADTFFPHYQDQFQLIFQSPQTQGKHTFTFQELIRKT